MRQVVKLRSMDHQERLEQDATLELYCSTLGME